MRWTIPRPASDVVNIARQLQRDGTQDETLLRWLIDHRIKGTKRLLDDLWPQGDRLAAALYGYGSLRGDEVEALIEGY